MASNAGLFDDEDDEQEYVPPTQDTGASQENTEAAQDYSGAGQSYSQEQYDAAGAASSAPANPYADHVQQNQQQYDYNQANYGGDQNQQNQQQNQGLFDDGDEDEYKPPENTQENQDAYSAAQPTTDTSNPYPDNSAANQAAAADNYAPIGFGAERANLMQEQNISVPATADNNVMKPDFEEEKKDTVAENKLNEQATQAKNKLLAEINAFKDAPEMVAAAGAQNDAEDANAENPFSVKDPVAVGNVIKYSVNGVDSQGPWQAQRRYNEFEALRRVLGTRWPGCYIPSIPEKVTVNVNMDKMSIQGNKDAAFVEERRSLLESFIREISKFDFLIESKEMQMFARGAGEVAKQLEELPKQSPTEILEKYRLNFSIDEDQATSEIARYKEKINIFTVYLRKAIVSLEKQSEAFHKYSNAQNDSMKHYQRIYYNFLKFEDDAIEYLSENDRSKRLLTNPANPDVPGDIVANINLWKRSFKDVWVWLKGECLEVKGMMDAMQGRDKLIIAQQKAEEKKRDKQTELDKMSMGKTTLKSFFKTKSTIEKDILNYQADIEQLNIDIEEYRKLISFITIYQGQLAIDKFKRIKVNQYMKMLNSFSVKEISNAHLQATLAHQILVLSDNAGKTE